MTTIDLSTPPPPPASLLDALPRRVVLTLPELQLVAARAGGAPLPFDVADPADASSGDTGAGLEGRLGASRGTTDAQAYANARTTLHDPETSLARRGLLAGGEVDAGLAGAVGLLATPAYAVDADVAVTVGTTLVQVKAWHRATDDAVATLATCDGLVFELAWFAPVAWPAELARIPALPEDLDLHESAVPDALDAPYELVDAVVEAISQDRGDLVEVLVGREAEPVRDADGGSVHDVEAQRVIDALAGETRGRMRVLVADVSGRETTVVGLRSWVLVADGWRSLRPHRVDDVARVEVRAVQPADLAADLAPVLAEVAR